MSEEGETMNANDAHPSMSMLQEANHAPIPDAELPFTKSSPSKYIWRGLSVPIIAGQVLLRTQISRSLPSHTSPFVGMAFITIQFVREFTRLGLNRRRLGPPES